MIDTLVVDEARVSAAVNKVHITALKARLSRKKMARMRNSIGRLGLERWKESAREVDHEVVRAVVVLSVRCQRRIWRVMRFRCLQLRENAIEGCAGSAGYGEGEPGGFAG